jgi:O-succinylbenzoate synthase
VDANAAYRLDDVDHLKKLDDFDLMMIEQPLDYRDILDHSRLQKQLKTPICLDESIRDYRDARHALEMDACRIINIKQARVGGTFAAKVIHNVAKADNVPVWCGGLLETGIGRAHNVALASLPGFTLPGDISASARFYVNDIIDPEVKLTSRGTIEVTDKPGMGYDVVEDLIRRYQVRQSPVLA